MFSNVLIFLFLLFIKANDAIKRTTIRTSTAYPHEFVIQREWDERLGKQYKGLYNLLNRNAYAVHAYEMKHDIVHNLTGEVLYSESLKTFRVPRRDCSEDMPINYQLDSKLPLQDRWSIAFNSQNINYTLFRDIYLTMNEEDEHAGRVMGIVQAGARTYKVMKLGSGEEAWVSVVVVDGGTFGPTWPSTNNTPGFEWMLSTDER